LNNVNNAINIIIKYLNTLTHFVVFKALDISNIIVLPFSAPHPCFFFSGSWILTQGLTLANQALYFLSHPTSPLCACVHACVCVCVCVCVCWIFLRWDLENYLPQAVFWTTILFISASWVVRITSVHHQHPAQFPFQSTVWDWTQA
jgi:hypothetical protein